VSKEQWIEQAKIYERQLSEERRQNAELKAENGRLRAELAALKGSGPKPGFKTAQEVIDGFRPEPGSALFGPESQL
jgi:cell division protein FtsB